MSNMPSSTPRKYYLDWLRVLGILVVFLYHSCRFFDVNNSWHIKNAVTSGGVRLLLTFAEQWMMPLMIVISGASVFYALSAHKVGKFIKDRVLRLLVPLVVGIFTHSIWQIYLERTWNHQFSGSFWQFIPEYFKGLYGFGGNFAWMGVHLWYLEVLFVLSLLLLPVFWFFKTTFGARVLRWIGNVLAVPGVFYLLALPLIPLVNISEEVPWGMQDFGGWSLSAYLWLLFIGFVLFSHERLLERIRQFRWVSLVLALLVGGVGFVLYALRLDLSGTLGGFGAFLREEHTDLGCWMWLLTLIGFAMQHLNFRTRFTDYANEGVLPFYILHQPVLLTVGLFVIPLSLPAALKWAIIMPISFAIVMVLYEFVVRRLNVVRILFGMKWQRRAAPAVVSKEPEVAKA